MEDFDYLKEKQEDLMQEYLIQLGELTVEDDNNHERNIEGEKDE